MVVSRKIFFYAAIITIFLFISIYSLNLYMNNQRENFVLDRMEQILDEYQELQTLSIMSNAFGEEMTCLSLENTLSHLDKTLWDTGIKIDRYREVTEQFVDDPFYIDQKRKFNRNEVVYLSMLENMKHVCDFNQTIILYFYKKKEDCKDCDAQAFVLTDLNKEIDEEIAIFSFDLNLELPSLKTLQVFYNITSYPCIVVENSTYCGLLDKNQIEDILCDYREHSICESQQELNIRKAKLLK